MSLIRSNKALHVPESPEGARAGSPAAGTASPRNGPSRLRRDSAGPRGRPGPPHPPQPEPCAAATAANTAASAPDAPRGLLAVGRAVGLRGRGRRPPPGSCCHRLPALRPRRAPACPPAPAGGRQLLQPPAAAAASHLRAPPDPDALTQPQLQSQSSGRVLAQRLALAPPALPSCFHMQYQSQTGRRPPPRKHLGRARCTPVLAAPSWGRAGGLGPLYLPFSFRPGWGGKRNPQKTTENTQNRRLFICF